MQNSSIDNSVLSDPSWWHWALTVPLLAADLCGIAHAIDVAIALCLVMSGYYFARVRALKPFPVQIRLAYSAWLSCGLIPGLFWMHWVALLGTTAMVTLGYCPLARMLKLLPFNRNEPLTPALIWRQFVDEPCAGGLVSWPGGCGSSTAGPCSMLSRNDRSPAAQPAIKKGNHHVRSV